MGAGDGAEVASIVLARIRERLAAGETPSFPARGHSMWPTLRDGDAVRIVPLRPGGPGLGEIVLAVTPVGLVLHRVIARRSGAVLLKGDARPAADGWCPTGQLAGRLAPRGPGSALAPLRALLTRATGPCAARLLGVLRRAERGLVGARRARGAPRGVG
jgi:hypothetical protein